MEIISRGGYSALQGYDIIKVGTAIKLKNDLLEINRMAEELERYCNKEQLPLKTALDLNLVLEELVTNIISYAYEDERAHIISIRIKRNNNMLTVEVEDDGRPFNPLDIPPPKTDKPLDDLEPGGLGIHFVRNLTDEISYRRQNNFNILTFRKKVFANK